VRGKEDLSLLLSQKKLQNEERDGEKGRLLHPSRIRTEEKVFD